MQTNPVVWFEIHVQDLARARRFYETVLAITMEAIAPPPREGEGAGAGDGDCPGGEMQMLGFPSQMENAGASGMLVQMDGMPPGGGGTMVYFGCDDCAVEQGRVVAAGGQVFKPKFSIGPYGHCAVVIDTEGNTIGLHSMQ